MIDTLETSEGSNDLILEFTSIVTLVEPGPNNRMQRDLKSGTLLKYTTTEEPKT